MRKEINTQIMERDKQYWLDMDAAVLYSLHKEFGFGAGRLRRFFDRFSVVHEDLRQHYQLDIDEPDAWICRYLLKQETGADVEAWEKEYSNGKTL